MYIVPSSINNQNRHGKFHFYMLICSFIVSGLVFIFLRIITTKFVSIIVPIFVVVIFNYFGALGIGKNYNIFFFCKNYWLWRCSQRVYLNQRINGAEYEDETNQTINV